jgi:hypothetical protein
MLLRRRTYTNSGKPAEPLFYVDCNDNLIDQITGLSAKSNENATSQFITDPEDSSRKCLRKVAMNPINVSVKRYAPDGTFKGACAVVRSDRTNANAFTATTSGETNNGTRLEFYFAIPTSISDPKSAIYATSVINENANANANGADLVINTSGLLYCAWRKDNGTYNRINAPISPTRNKWYRCTFDSTLTTTTNERVRYKVYDPSDNSLIFDTGNIDFSVSTANRTETTFGADTYGGGSWCDFAGCMIKEIKLFKQADITDFLQ